MALKTCEGHYDLVVVWYSPPAHCPLCEAENIVSEQAKELNELRDIVEKLEAELAEMEGGGDGGV